MSKFIKIKSVLFLDGLFLCLIGFPQTLNSYVGFKFNIGLYKILHELTFAGKGVFETAYLLGVLGVIFLNVRKNKDQYTFWLIIMVVVHAFIVTSNIIFWETSFVVNGASRNGAIATIYHLIACIIALIIIISSFKKNENA